MSFIVYLLGAGIFALTTSEYMVSGLMPELSAEFNVSFPAIGYLVTIYAGTMAIGGPLLTVGLLKVSRKNALLGLIALFIVGQVIGSMAQGYNIMVVARVITGIAAAAFFGVALTTCAELVDQKLFARAASVVLGGLMVGTVFGLPGATLLGEWFGWRVSFMAVAVIALLVGLLVIKVMPAMPAPSGTSSLRSELAAFKSGKLWGIYATSLLLIGATFAGFTYFVPILTDISGFSPATVPLLLVIYGLATLVGNTIVGRLADAHTIAVIVVGLVATIAAMVIFAMFGQIKAVAVAALVVIGLTGVSMNPALVTRGARVGRNNMLVNSVHTACIMLGVMVGSWIGGVGISAGLGLPGALWIGAGLAILALATLAPEFRATRSPVISHPVE
ncbi:MULTISPECIES: MFS transporter [Serratia]|jgi:predicted MFS family arabinose efflux permease|uniref:MFS transporter n=1 Tax=Serratia TaxID=613 RepID=UPI00074304F8|nr:MULTISPECIES: MFS transporter [Serratia]ALX94529.1 MFS transporter [Serratia fonticola]NXZ86446.1 MFS transporter [Serratia fonticola]QIP93809.1 Arabinose efflux permease [Serratia fonticola]UAN59666.1 MFS transporter [Serratia sp. JSRIV004]